MVSAIYIFCFCNEKTTGFSVVFCGCQKEPSLLTSLRNISKELNIGRETIRRLYSSS